jgi:hypothetical protein
MRYLLSCISRYTKAKAFPLSSKEVGLEANPEKTKYILVSRC